jgi:hypothetical protein
MPNPQNLRPRPPWRKGVSGNPKGRPPKGIVFEDLMKLIDESPGMLREISKIWLREILAANYQFFREYLDRSDGKPVPMVEAPDTEDMSDFGILVRVPTVKQAKRKARVKARKSAKPT